MFLSKKKEGVKMNNSINPINSSVSFKATLKTPFKTGAMPEIVKEFENITKNVKGTLVFDYASSEVKSSGLKEFVYNGITYVTRKANKYINPAAESLTPKEIKTVAMQFADVLKALKIEDAYVKKINPHETKINELEKQVQIEAAKKKRAEKHQLPGLVDIYAKNIKALNSSIKKEEAIIEKNNPAWLQAMIGKLEKYQKHELLGDYVDFIKMDYL